MSTYLVIDEQQFSLEDIKKYCMENWPSIKDEWYCSVNAHMANIISEVISSMEDTVKHEQEEKARLASVRNKQFQLEYEQAELNRQFLDEECFNARGVTIKHAHESWYTYNQHFDMHEILVEGPATFTNTHAWTGPHSANKNWSCECTDATIVDILIMFEDSIIQTGDQHHCFLESIVITEKDCKTYVNFSTGS